MFAPVFGFKFKKSIQPNRPCSKNVNIDEQNEENKNIEEKNIINAKPRLSRYKIPALLYLVAITIIFIIIYYADINHSTALHILCYNIFFILGYVSYQEPFVKPY